MATETAPTTDIPSIGDALAELAADARAADEAAPEEQTEETPGGEPEAPAKGAKPAAAKGKPDPKSAPAHPEEPAEGELKEDFSDERPWTPERVKAAANEARQLARKAQSMWATEQKRAAKLGTKREEFLREKSQFVAVRDAIASDIQMLRTGSPSARLEALGRLTGQDGVNLWEELSVEMARGGKKKESAAPSKEVLELRAELDELKGLIRGRQEQDAATERDRFVAQRKVELAEHVTGEAESYPYLSEYESSEIGEALAEIIVAEYDEGRGRRISDAQAAQILERRLQDQAERLERAKAKLNGGAPKGASGLDTRAKAKPGQAQSTPPSRGRSLAPGLTTQVNSRRELTEEEQAEDAADFIPAAFLRFGGAR